MERLKLFSIPELLAIIFIPLAVGTGCDKTENAAQRFVKEGRWIVSSITIADDPVDKLPKWDVPASTDFSIYNNATWEHPFGTTAGFLWKFSNLGGTFTFEPAPGSDTGSMAFAQCTNFSGEYKVIRSKRDTFHFESSTTHGYPGKMVTMLLEAE